jgi:hypothetical protein
LQAGGHRFDPGWLHTGKCLVSATFESDSSAEISLGTKQAHFACFSARLLGGRLRSRARSALMRAVKTIEWPDGCLNTRPAVQHRRTNLRCHRATGYAWASSELTAPLGERREEIQARRAGYLLVHERRLRRIARRGEYRQERLRLAMVSVIGQPVERNDELFSLIPAHGSTLTRGDIWRGARLQRIRRYGDIDGVGEYIGALLSLANAQARAGNVAGAERVRESLLELLRLHLRGVRSSRTLHDPEEQVGLIPALRTLAVQGIRALADSDDANTRELNLGLLQRTLAHLPTLRTFSLQRSRPRSLWAWPRSGTDQPRASHLPPYASVQAH